ncbi:hypothetical protein M432DRAFT_652993 [Thermoascus aurantiacus ATCC 26904]
MPPLTQPTIDPNTFLSLVPSSHQSPLDDDPHPPQPLTTTTTTTTITIFFIPGNPGLIAYYHAFLALLSSALSGPSVVDGRRASRFRIYGASLGGFEVDEEIDFVEGRLRSVMSNGSSDHDGWKQPPTATTTATAAKPQVILVGHSVGAYIAMEILRRHREGRREDDDGYDAAFAFDIVGAVLLFPAVVDIAKSTAGRRLSWLLYLIPELARVTGLLAKALTWALPAAVLRSLVRLVMGFPPENAVETTLAFLGSRRGVRQALHMAADEMREITADRWSDDIWGTSSSTSSMSSSAKKPPSKLVFYFGRNDHWVAERTRDEIIATRGRRAKGGGPKMVVCEDGVPHAFCIRHSDVMARKVARFIMDIVTGD